MVPKLSDLISLQDAARQLGKSERTLRRNIAQGRLRTERLPGTTAVWLYAAEITGLDPRGVGRPRRAQVSRDAAVGSVLEAVEHWPPSAREKFHVSALGEATGPATTEDLVRYFAGLTTSRGPWGQTFEVAILSEMGLSMDRIARRMNMSKRTVQELRTRWHAFPTQMRVPAAPSRPIGLNAQVKGAGARRLKRQRSKWAAPRAVLEWNEDYDGPDDPIVYETDEEEDDPLTAEEEATAAAEYAKHMAELSVCRCAELSEVRGEDAWLYSMQHLVDRGLRPDGATRVWACPDLLEVLWQQTWVALDRSPTLRRWTEPRS